MRVRPTSFTVTGSFKAYGMRDGMSSGSEVSVTFEVLPDTPLVEVKREIVRQQFMVDTMCLRTELGKGMIPTELFKELHTRAKISSETILSEYKDGE